VAKGAKGTSLKSAKAKNASRTIKSANRNGKGAK
jgi:hypothetical protein